MSEENLTLQLAMMTFFLSLKKKIHTLILF